MTLKQSESGRSMVEMLGTLAIIGVLSVGGIMGYSYGMNRYRANGKVMTYFPERSRGFSVCK